MLSLFSSPVTIDIMFATARAGWMKTCLCESANSERSGEERILELRKGKRGVWWEIFNFQNGSEFVFDISVVLTLSTNDSGMQISLLANVVPIQVCCPLSSDKLHVASEQI